MNNEPVAWMSQGGDVSRSKKHFEEIRNPLGYITDFIQE